MSKFKKNEKKPVRSTEPVTVKPKNKEAKQLAEGWNNAETRGALVKSKLLAGMAKFGEEKFGRLTVRTGESLKRLSLGIPIPLAFQYLIGRSRLPLSLAFSVSGPPGHGKTTLILELFKFIFRRDGLGVFLNNEGKLNAELAQAIFGGKSLDDYNFLYNDCETQEDWQSRFTDYMKQIKKMMVGTSEEPGPGKKVPFALCVDGLQSAASMETVNNINKIGYASRAYAIEAGNNTRYFSAKLQELRHWPFIAIFGLHRKTRTDENGNKEDYTPGGTVTTFLEAIELAMTYKSGLERTSKFSARTFSMTVAKNSLEADDRFLQARVLYWKTRAHEPNDEDPDPPYVQRAMWDWPHALIKLLTSDRIKPMLKKMQFDDGKDFHLESSSAATVENACWSKTLGVPEKAPISYSAMGKKIEADAALVKKLRYALDIADVPAMTGDYEEQLSDLEKKNQEIIDRHERSAKDRTTAKKGSRKPGPGGKG